MVVAVNYYFFGGWLETLWSAASQQKPLGSWKCQGMMVLHYPCFLKEPFELKQAAKIPIFTCFYPAVSADNSSWFNAYHIDRQIPFSVCCSACHSHSQWFCVIFPDSHHLLMTGDSVKSALWWQKQQQQTRWARRPPDSLSNFYWSKYSPGNI